MYYHHMQEMVEQLVTDGLVDPNDRVNALESIEKCWEDKIALVWMIDDIKSSDPTISDELAKAVLEALLDFDPEIGVNWLVIDALVASIKESDYEKKRVKHL